MFKHIMLQLQDQFVLTESSFSEKKKKIQKKYRKKITPCKLYAYLKVSNISQGLLFFFFFDSSLTLQLYFCLGIQAFGDGLASVEH